MTDKRVALVMGRTAGWWAKYMGIDSMPGSGAREVFVSELEFRQDCQEVYNERMAEAEDGS